MCVCMFKNDSLSDRSNSEKTLRFDIFFFKNLDISWNSAQYPYHLFCPQAWQPVLSPWLQPSSDLSNQERLVSNQQPWKNNAWPNDWSTDYLYVREVISIKHHSTRVNSNLNKVDCSLHIIGLVKGNTVQHWWVVELSFTKFSTNLRETARALQHHRENEVISDLFSSKFYSNFTQTIN